MRLPAPPIIRMMAAKADLEHRMLFPPTADDIINAHITIARHHGIQFDPWTTEGEARFLGRRRS